MSNKNKKRDTVTVEVPTEYIETEEFKKWRESLDKSNSPKIDTMIDKLSDVGVITNSKALPDGLYEKKYTNGLRVYFAVIIKDGKKTLLLLGSGKGKEQQKAIKSSEKELADYEVFKGDISFKD